MVWGLLPSPRPSRSVVLPSIALSKAEEAIMLVHEPDSPQKSTLGKAMAQEGPMSIWITC
jgi:hypothetical protein